MTYSIRPSSYENQIPNIPLAGPSSSILALTKYVIENGEVVEIQVRPLTNENRRFYRIDSDGTMAPMPLEQVIYSSRDEAVAVNTRVATVQPRPVPRPTAQL